MDLEVCVMVGVRLERLHLACECLVIACDMANLICVGTCGKNREED